MNKPAGPASSQGEEGPVSGPARGRVGGERGDGEDRNESTHRESLSRHLGGEKRVSPSKSAEKSRNEDTLKAAKKGNWKCGEEEDTAVQSPMAEQARIDVARSNGRKLA